MIPKKYLLSIALIAINISLFSMQYESTAIERSEKTFASLKLLLYSSNTKSNYNEIVSIAKTLLQSPNITFDELTQKGTAPHNPYKVAVIFALTKKSDEIDSFFDTSAPALLRGNELKIKKDAKTTVIGIQNAIKSPVLPNKVGSVTDAMQMSKIGEEVSDVLTQLKTRETTTLPNGSSVTKDVPISMTEAIANNGVFNNSYRDFLERYKPNGTTNDPLTIYHVAYLFGLSAHCKTTKDSQDLSSLLTLGGAHSNRQVGLLLGAFIGAFWGEKVSNISEMLKNSEFDGQIVYLTQQLRSSQTIPGYKFNEEEFNKRTSLDHKKPIKEDIYAETSSCSLSWGRISLFIGIPLALLISYYFYFRK